MTSKPKPLSLINPKSSWKIAVLFAAFLPIFNIIITSQYRLNADPLRMFSSGLFTFSFLMVCWYVNDYLGRLFDEKKYTSITKKILSLILINAILLIFFIIIGIFILREINHPDQTAQSKISFWMVSLKGAVSIALITIIQYAINTSKKAQDFTLQNEMLKTENMRTQFEILKQQVNPHFLFNSLSTLRSMVRSNDPKSEDCVLKLAEIYRQLLTKRQKDIVTLKEELEFVGDYSFMLSARFGKMLTINQDIQRESLDRGLPTFSLQLLLENCIKHNVISTQRPLEIRIFTSLGFITVENNMQSKTSLTEPSGYGLKNLIQRYSLLGHEDGVLIYSDEEVFRVRLELIDP